MEVRPAAQEIAAFLAEQNCNHDEMTACGLALAEACNNAIHYAPSEARSFPIRIETQVTRDAIEIRVTDHTHGFDWPKEIALPEPGRESGRGLFIIHSVSDRAGYLRGQNQNVLFFRHVRTSRPREIELAPRDSVTEQLIDEVSSCYESLAAIFRHSAAAHADTQFQTFAQQLLNDLQRIVKADWFVLRLLSADAQSLEVFASSGADPDHPSIILDTSGGLPQEPEAQAASSRRPVWFNDAASSGLVHPIFGSEQLVGTLTLGRNTKGQGTLGSTIFNASQTNVISTLADFLMIQVERARAAEAQLTARATERELEIARNIQLSLLPQQLPALPGVRMAAHCESARQVGGDFYDALPVSHEATLLVIADVMGKGMPAALFAATLRTALRSAPELFRKPGQLLARANQLLHDELSAVDMFITAQLALVDVKANRVIIASAGHGPLLLWHGGTTTCQALSPEGLPLGVRPDTTFEETRLVLAPQFSLMMSTDGLSEAKNIAGQHLGQPALQQWFATSARNSDTAIAMRESLLTELGNFRGEAPLADDQTFLIAARTPE
jgi:serine phosphatase RsbU (regulator of sigma subunit)/anti-sigma regulatory factor (Ser/Thr protein kinase)